MRMAVCVLRRQFKFIKLKEVDVEIDTLAMPIQWIQIEME